MQIQLNDSGPSMWFLGKPGEIKVSLNYANRGPVSIDFDKLDHEEKTTVLVALRDGKILSDMTYQQLYEKWLTSRPVVPQATPEVQAHLDAIQQHKQENKRGKIEEVRRAREEKFMEHCVFLSKSGIRALRAGTKTEKDIRVFRTLRSLEEQRKKMRVSVKDYLAEKINELQKQVVQDIEDSINQPALTIPKGFLPKETITFDVIESEQETVEFSTEDLSELASGKPLGGE